MFEQLKDKITDLAYIAVNHAEKKLETSTGQEKKKAAIIYLVNRLCFPPLFKPFLILLFNNFIDNAIEKAVEYMNQLKNED